MVAQVVGEGRDEEPVDGGEVIGELDSGDLYPVRTWSRLERSCQVDLHVPEVVHRAQAQGLQYRRRGQVAGIDRMPEPTLRDPGQQADCPVL
jgi:hypothetical protein